VQWRLADVQSERRRDERADPHREDAATRWSQAAPYPPAARLSAERPTIVMVTTTVLADLADLLERLVVLPHHVNDEAVIDLVEVHREVVR
jgi:hypothetical protein